MNEDVTLLLQYIETTLVTTWQRYLITPVNRDDLSNDMATLPYYSSK